MDAEARDDVSRGLRRDAERRKVRLETAADEIADGRDVLREDKLVRHDRDDDRCRAAPAGGLHEDVVQNRTREASRVLLSELTRSLNPPFLTGPPIDRDGHALRAWGAPARSRSARRRRPWVVRYLP